MLFYILGYSLLLPLGKPPSKICSCSDKTTVETQEFVHQQDAEYFRVLPVIGIRLLRLRLELRAGYLS